MTSPIKRFNGEYRWLSNFWIVPIQFEGNVYRSVEHAYQASKCADITERVKFQSPTMAPADAKRLGRRVKVRADWETVKLDIMYRLVFEKFTNHKNLGRKLIDTGSRELIEDNTWGDTYWGVCRGQGNNHLGRVLMRVRKQINKC